MADPISIIGAVGAMAGIIDVVTKSIRSLSDLRDRWKEADLTLLTLESQLIALRGALDQIREWMDNDLQGDPHHQLVMDLDVSIKCCQLLMSKINLLLGELGDTVDEPLDFSSIVKLVFRGKSIEDVQRLILQQTSALTLLITACNCKTLSEQTSLLQKSKTRKVLGRAQLDSSSLYVNRDSSSIVSRFTDNLSKISVVFDFDSELFSSKIYQQALRGSAKEALRRQQGLRQSIAKTQTTAKRSKLIDRNRSQVSGEFKVAVLGSDTGGKAEFMRMVKLMIQDDSDEELVAYRILIHQNVTERAKELFNRLKRSTFGFEVDVNVRYRDFLNSYSLMPPEWTLQAHMGEAISSMWKDPCIKKFLDSGEVDIKDFAPYFLDEIKRISQDDYVPTHNDILKAYTYGFRKGVIETVLPNGVRKMRLVDVAGKQSAVRKCLDCFEGAMIVLFFVDLAGYDKESRDNEGMTELQEELGFFHFIVNSRWFENSTFLLNFTNFTAFKERLTWSPLTNVFPDYQHRFDHLSAIRYISDLFESQSESKQHQIVARVHEKMVSSNALRGSGLR